MSPYDHQLLPTMTRKGLKLIYSHSFLPSKNIFYFEIFNIFTIYTKFVYYYYDIVISSTTIELTKEASK
jgi:hypothetical protein